jgi:signal transduction histidine kinase
MRGNNSMGDRQESIMVVDDTPANLRLLTDILQTKGYIVLTFPRGALALAAAAKNPPDLILLDINMPEMNGFEVCERLKADETLKDIPVIFISALTETEDKIKAFSLGAVDYVTKPFQCDEVYARVESHLRQRRQHIELRTLNSLKDHFLGMAAHDLRNPLSAIFSLNELLIEELSPTLTTEQTDYFDTITAAGTFMVRLLNDLLDVCAIESGNLTLERQLIDISALTTKIVGINRIFAAPKNKTIIFTCLEDLPSVFVDAHRIEQVINNLLSNAMKYSHPGTCIRITLLHENDEIIISVADQGPGIPEKDQHKLFNAFGKTSVKPASDEDSSTGLGLLIVKKIVEAHGGRIWFKSELTKGTEFFFSLPVVS